MSSLLENVSHILYAMDFNMEIMISVVIGVVTFLLISYYAWSKRKTAVATVLGGIPFIGTSKPRFRKREKVEFYGRKIIRRVNSFARNTIRDVGRSRLKKRQVVMRLAKRILHLKKDQGGPYLRQKEPPQSLLEADWLEVQENRLPSEVIYMLSSVKVLGHFEKPIFLELCKHMESRFVPAGHYVFRVGDNDDSIFVVQSGQINVIITDPDGTKYEIKEVTKGESIHSLLSLLDVLTGHSAPYKTVCAVAAVDSTILRLPAVAFQLVLERFPESLVRVVQVIMVRLQRVTFMALHNYLGLSKELINPSSEVDPTLSIHSIKFTSTDPRRVSQVSFTVSSSEEDEETMKTEEVKNVSAGDDTEDCALPGSHAGTTPVQAPKASRLCKSNSLTHEVSNSPSTKSFLKRRRSLNISAGKFPLAQSSVESSTTSSAPLEQNGCGSKSASLGAGTTSKENATYSASRRFSYSVRSSAPHPRYVSRSLSVPSHNECSQSDFVAACTRARVELQGSLHDDPITTGSPPVRVGSDQDSPSPTRNKRNISTYSTSAPSAQHGAAVATEPELTNERIIELAAEDIAKLLGLSDTKLLQNRVFLRYVPAGRVIMKQGDQDAQLIFVVTGELNVLQQLIVKEAQSTLFVCHPGEFVGNLAVLTGEPSFFTIKAKSDSRIATISKSDFYSVMKEQPSIVLNVAHSVVKRLSPFVRQIDFTLDWMQLEAGRALFRQGDMSDCFYIMLNGRLRSVITHSNGKKELVGEFGRGEMVGLVEVLMQSNRTTTGIAIRDTELAQIPEELLNMIKRKYPQIVTRLIHLMGQRILGSIQNRPSITSVLSEHPDIEPRPTVANLATVAVVAVNEDVPLSNFTMELQHALSAIGPALRLTSNIIQNRLGSAALDSINKYRLSGWLSQQEDIHRMVLYQCDYRMTAWTQRCIRQADCILIVAKADSEPTVGKIEKQMEMQTVRAQKELILLHRPEAETPRNTAEWLNARGWCTSHHHIRCPKRVFSKKSQNKMMESYRRLFGTRVNRMTDFSRLARMLTGTSIGLVLGGGGARGMAHVGLIKSMQEAGIPIDIVGGTSIGSFIGGIWAEETNITRCTQRAREWSMGMTSLWTKILDLTYPVTAMFSGAAFNKSIEDVFKTRQIEDLWIPYFCISTDITASKMRVHTTGSLWRYVRASMSLSGYLPPLCDPMDGHLLLDGGYVNNLPADVMKSLGAQTIFAVNVGSSDDIKHTNYGDQLSGWWLLWKKWNPWATPVKVPDMTEIQSRLAYVSCVRQLEQVVNSNLCEYIRPPIEKYQTLQFGSFDEICDVGYNHGKTLLSAWHKKDLHRKVFRDSETSKSTVLKHHSKMPREANFTDLAELISRIDEPRLSSTNVDVRGPRSDYNSDEDDEYEDEYELSVSSDPNLSPAF